MPVYIAPDGTKTMMSEVRVGAVELSRGEETVNVVAVTQGDHNVVLMADEVRSLVAALQSMANEVRKANRAKEG